MNRLQEKYQGTVVPALVKKFNYTTVMQCPKIDKVVINLGVGDAIANPKLLDEAVAELTQISGQKPVITKAKKSIANFKLREGMPIGCKVTLRGERMYEFLDKLFNISLPRVRDFHCFRFIICIRCCNDNNIHSSCFVNFIKVNFREDQLFFYA